MPPKKKEKQQKKPRSTSRDSVVNADEDDAQEQEVKEQEAKEEPPKKTAGRGGNRKDATLKPHGEERAKPNGTVEAYCAWCHLWQKLESWKKHHKTKTLCDARKWQNHLKNKEFYAIETQKAKARQELILQMNLAVHNQSVDAMECHRIGNTHKFVGKDPSQPFVCEKCLACKIVGGAQLTKDARMAHLVGKELAKENPERASAIHAEILQAHEQQIDAEADAFIDANTGGEGGLDGGEEGADGAVEEEEEDLLE